MSLEIPVKNNTAKVIAVSREPFFLINDWLACNQDHMTLTMEDTTVVFRCLWVEDDPENPGHKVRNDVIVEEVVPLRILNDICEEILSKYYTDIDELNWDHFV